MSKPKTTTGTTTGDWIASEGDVVFTPLKAPPVLLSKLKLDRGSGERALSFVHDSLVRTMRQNEGTITGGSLDELLEDVDRYYAPKRIRTLIRPIETDDAVTIISISRNSIAMKNFGNARIRRLDPLSEEAAGFVFDSGDRLKDVKIKAGKENNQAATAVIAQVEDYLGALFGPNGLAYKLNTMQPLSLRIKRPVIDDMTEQEPQQAAKFTEIHQGFAAFYKSGNKCDRVLRVLIALARNSIESLVNLHVSLHNKRVGDLETRLKDVEQRLAEMDN